MISSSEALSIAALALGGFIAAFVAAFVYAITAAWFRARQRQRGLRSRL